ncbi:aminotransferase class IV family protein [Rhizobium sp. YIM 134829]|uniref:aminotransferase class IV family protein n=1 Tax=Rhizobium sp. YIM 134829 TaxID=3390453 RepID=UPI00397C36BD
MTDFTLIETMRFEPHLGILRRRLHLERLKRSANRLGFILPPELGGRLDAAVAEANDREEADALRVRLVLTRDGTLDITTTPFTPQRPGTVWHVRIAKTRLASRDPLLRYKTSRRASYEAARAEYAGTEADEVLLLNETGDPCEGTITSLFLDDGSGILKTPPISAGLLAGVLRTELICARKARVTRLSLADLEIGTLFMGNSLRGLIAARLIASDDPPLRRTTDRAGSLL